MNNEDHIVDTETKIAEISRCVNNNLAAEDLLFGCLLESARAMTDQSDVAMRMIMECELELSAARMAKRLEDWKP